VNGLVYFDQVSLLPTSHLLLVTVGIIVLLGGVWAVSLQAVIVDTWSGGEDVDEEGAVDESSLPECNPSPAALIPQTPEPERARSHSESGALPTPHSPVSPRRRATLHHHRQSSIGGTIPISSPPSSVHAPVFSIGLSPASPGFTLVPRERRRCTSGQSGGGPWDEVIRRVRTRRVASDSNVLAGEEVERGIEEAGTRGHERVDSRVRWAWLRRLIVGQRGVS
jgi:magnesium transporter